MSYHLVLYDVVSSVFEETNLYSDTDNVRKLAQAMNCDIEFQDSTFNKSSTAYYRDLDQLVKEDGACRRCVITGPTISTILQAQRVIYETFGAYANPGITP